ncbi:MAG: Ig-like domain-containing protein, partial [Gammaproteobacteria bacterium]|nr:Ig-like domain-containing protein [Gammaproteobacteria bacterium]
MLSNTGQQEGTVAYAAQSGAVQLGQRIRTGSHAAGYDLDGVVLRLVDTGSTPTVTIHGNSASNEPVLGSTLYTLTNPSTVTAGLNEFSAPADATLEADTDYWVILSAPGNPVTWRITTSTNLDAGAAAGWQISNGNAEIVFGKTTVRTDGSYQLQVKGAAISSDTVAPTVEIGGLSGTSGAVTVTISFSEDVTGFTVEDIAVSNGAVSNFAGSGAAYTATITPVYGGMVTSLVIAAGAAAD